MPHEIVVLLTGTVIDWDVTLEHQDIRHSPNVLEIVNEINRMISLRMGLPWCWQGIEAWSIVVVDIDNVTWRYVQPMLINTLRREQNGDVMVTDGFPSPEAAEAKSVQWRHNERFGVSNHQRLHCVLRCKSKKTLKLRVTGLCEGNSPVTGEFPAQRASNAENISNGMTSSWSNISLVLNHTIV